MQLPEDFEEFLSWYLAPWRRIGRAEFGLALLAVSAPGLVIMVFGLGSSAGSFIEPLVKGMSMMQGGDYEGLMGMAGQAAGVVPAPNTYHFDWAGTLNNLCLLAVAPLSRMRLRDMGWMGWSGLILTILFNLSVVEGLLQSISGVDLLPWGSLWGTLNLIGYIWLSSGKPKAHDHDDIDGQISAKLAAQDLQSKIDNEHRLNEQGYPTRSPYKDEDFK